MRAKLWLSVAALSVAANLSPTFDRIDASDAGASRSTASSSSIAVVATRSALVHTLAARAAAGTLDGAGSHGQAAILVHLVAWAGATDAAEAAAWLDPATGILHPVAPDGADKCYDPTSVSSGS